jgi:hypothetical protein
MQGDSRRTIAGIEKRVHRELWSDITQCGHIQRVELFFALLL